MHLLKRSIVRDEIVRKVRIAVGVTLLTVILFSVVLVISLQSYQLFFEREEETATIIPFPVGVRPAEQRIVEQPSVSNYLHEYFVQADDLHISESEGFLKKFTAMISGHRLWQQFASPMTRVLVIWPGERKEQAVKLFGDILDWSTEERAEFSSLVLAENTGFSEGVFSPGKYVVPKTANPKYVARLVNERFSNEVKQRYTTDVEMLVPFEQAIIIASLLEREAYSFDDMRVISGVIWNRLFSDMNLQIDATLQYVKGSRPYGAWWPKVLPSDKYLDSEFNTYLNKGLPPAPISNPSPEAILAALNPRNTVCYYYFHDVSGNFYCSPTYKEHVAQLKSLYGRGK